MLRAHHPTTYIAKIRDTHGKTQHLPHRILPTIRSYFATLYDLPTPETDAGRTLHSQKIHAYLSQHVTRQLTPETALLLDAPLTTEELSDAVKSSKTGKCPGPDGLPLQYYKRFAKILYPRFLVAFNAILEGHTIPSQTQTANISLIPKEGKDAERCDSYRPISLLNCDLKLYAKILATRLTPYVPGLIHQDQVGFVAGREARDNTIRALTIMHRATRQREGLLFLSTDAEKAFDRVNWEFLFATLSQVGLGPNLCTRIRALYSDPTARVCVNGIYTEPFKIRNGTRQGCPLSPLLFVLALEPFLSSVRASPDIRGIRTGRTKHRVAAFADDLLFFVTHPETTLPNLLKAFEVYGNLSNLKINFAKSFLLNVSMPRSKAQSIRPNFSIQWAEDRIKYLGIWLTSDHTLMFRDNFAPMLATISTDLKAWNYPHISWLGRVHAIKMNVLPRILYLFQTIPIDLPRTFFRDLQMQIWNCVWRGSRPRLKFSILTLPNARGGLAIPDFAIYHTACHLQCILEWAKPRKLKAWGVVEQDEAGIPLTVLPWLPKLQGLRRVRDLHYTSATLRIWHRVMRVLDLSSDPSPLTPLLCQASTPTSYTPSIFTDLLQTQTPRIRDVFRDQQLASLTDILGDRAVTFLRYFRYQQIASFIRSIPQRTKLTRPLTEFEKQCMTADLLPHGVSYLYELLQRSNRTPPPAEVYGQLGDDVRNYSVRHTMGENLRPYTPLLGLIKNTGDGI
uniref:Reverse transcriptase domain-containing protein n=1 Tax=Leptobrachium leishanense TaxID=445787 RepID=A0A8C5PG93_9ANUR